MAYLNEIARRVLPGHTKLVEKVSESQRWKIEQDAETGLTYIHMIGGKGVGKSDPYLLRLEFDNYPAQPPSALFVNQETRDRGSIQEQPSFWPIFNKQPPAISITMDNKVGGLYLCFPYTYEFEVTHDKSQHRWNPSNHHILTTLIILQKEMSGQGYGRYST